MRLRFGEFLLDREARQLFREGIPVHLQPKVFELLDLLVQCQPRALSKAAIRGRLWADIVVGEASLTVAVAELRAALGDEARQPRYIRTVHGFGYAFGTDVVGELPSPTRPDHTLPTPRIVWEKRVIPLLRGDNVLGRDERATVRIDAPGVSRRHALIRVADSDATIEDLGSKNGTFLGNGASLITAAAPLADQATFCLGRVRLQFRWSADTGSTTTDALGSPS